MTTPTPAKWGKRARLVRGSLRYKLMQGISKILWGRKIDYLSWWYHSSRSAGAIFHHNGKVLMGKRRGTLDNPGQFSLIGGFVDDRENSKQATSRETWEETRLEIPPEAFEKAPVFAIQETCTDIAEQTDMTQVCVWYLYELSDEQVANLQTTEEVSEFVWLDQATLDDLKAKNLIAFARHYDLVNAFLNGKTL